jgi:hypothetical protein
VGCAAICIGLGIATGTGFTGDFEGSTSIPKSFPSVACFYIKLSYTLGTIIIFGLIKQCLSGGNLSPNFSGTKGSGILFFLVANFINAYL